MFNWEMSLSISSIDGGSRHRWETGLECASKVQRRDHECLRCRAMALGTIISEKKHKLVMVSLRDLGN